MRYSSVLRPRQATLRKLCLSAVRLLCSSAVARLVVARLALLAQFVGFRPPHYCSPSSPYPHQEAIKENGRNKNTNQDHGLKNTQLLEVMAKQQSEAQAAAAAAMTAQNEALKSFQETIASVVVPLSQRSPTAVHLPKKKPHVPGLGWRPDKPTPLVTPGRPNPSDQRNHRHRGSTFCPTCHGRCGILALK